MNLNCAPEIKGRLVSRDLLSTEVRIIHTPWPNVVWKLLFQLRSQVSLNFSGSKYLFFVTSHSDLPVSPCLFLFTSLLHLVHKYCKIQNWGVSNTFSKWVETQWLFLLKYLFVLIKVFWRNEMAKIMEISHLRPSKKFSCYIGCWWWCSLIVVVCLRKYFILFLICIFLGCWILSQLYFSQHFKT